MGYNAYDELMRYFKFEFNIYGILALIVLVGAVKAVGEYVDVRRAKRCLYKRRLYDLIPSILALLGLSNALFFQGVVSDIPSGSGALWGARTLYVSAVAVVFFIVQLVFRALTDACARRLEG